MSSPIAMIKKTSAVTPRKTMRGHTGRVEGVAHLPGGQRIITCSFDGSLRIWDLESGTQIGDEWRDEGDEAGVRTMALSPDGKTVASGSQDGTVTLWDVETEEVVVKWKGHSEFVKSVCWSPNGERVVSGSWDGTVRVWHVESGEHVQGLNPIKTGHQQVYVVSYSLKTTKIATGGYNEDGIKIWDAERGELLSTIRDKFKVPVWSLTWTSDEKKLIAGLRNGSIRIFDTATWHQIAFLDGHRNDRLLASTSWDCTARLWNLDTNLQIGLPLQHENHVECAAFSTNGKLLFTACDDQNAYVWDIQAILRTTGLEDLLSIPDAQKSELKKKSLSGANATQRPAPHRLLGFFDDVQDRGPPDPNLHRRRGAFAPSWGSNPRVLLTRLPLLFRRSRPNVDEPIELQQRPRPSTSSRGSPPVVEVSALDDKKFSLRALYTARRPERAGDKAKRIKNPSDSRISPRNSFTTNIYVGGVSSSTNVIATRPPSSPLIPNMTIISNDSTAWPVINAYRFRSYFFVAALVGVAYDWVSSALTFGQEVELIWRQRWSLMTILYLSVRYLGILFTALDMLSWISFVVWNWTTVLVFAMLWVIIITRLHAMYQGSRKILIFLIVTALAEKIFNVVVAIMATMYTSGEEFILSGTYQCSISYLGDIPLLSPISWILGTVWEVLALSLAIWIAVKHLRERRRHSARGIIEDCFTVLIQTHVLYFLSFVAVSCFHLIINLSPTLLADQNSLETQIYYGLIQISAVVQMFVLGPRLILGVREYHAKLVADSDAATGMTSIAFQERVYISTGNGV
ncbi:WD40-repeat-containing domain protein [Suillus subalutaceus]|uniref:WD40-repeat-containing domain protein n=1 Tax=Suillus subalutaceus TaxID=48586 RepID=UPI001B860A14|nr:WD40-repeat-containing domain protein [Suillus subalutaceus]KAG1844333.1 WD40-repeat-containing domain protein [Suillus subalutaceus]